MGKLIKFPKMKKRKPISYYQAEQLQSYIKNVRIDIYMDNKDVELLKNAPDKYIKSLSIQEVSTFMREQWTLMKSDD